MATPARFRVLLAAASFVLAPSVAAEVHRVDPGGGGDHSTIRAAVDAAAHGDVILVLPGTYADDVVVDGLDIWIAATVPGEVQSLGRWSIKNIAAGDRVVLTGVTIDRRDEVPGPVERALEVLDCEGDVVLSECQVLGRVGERFELAGRVVELTGSKRVSAIRSRFTGGSGASGLGGIGVLATGSRLVAWDCEIEGGHGWTVPFAAFLDAEPGGAGVRLLAGSEVLVVGGSVVGGDGGDHWDFIGSEIVGDGGHVFSADAGTRVYLQATQLTPGSGGESGSPNMGAVGRLFAGSGTARFLGGGVARLHAAGPFARAQAPFEITLVGVPGERFGLFLQLAAPPFPLDEIRPTGGGIAPHVSLFRGALVGVSAPIPPGGALSLQLPIPAIPAVPPATGAFLFARSRGYRSFLGTPMPFMALHCGALTPDCDGNGQADLCDLIAGSSTDANQNGLPDACEGDCNGNGIPDVSDIASGFSLDFNGNLVPDECESNTTWYVDPTGTGQASGTFAAPFRSLLQARQAVINGDEVVLKDGVYAGSLNKRLDFGRRQITIRSLGGPSACVIDLAGSSGRGFLFNMARGNGGVTLQGLTMRGGEAGTQMGNGVNLQGGAVAARLSDVRIEDCVFEDNRGGGGGAVALQYCGAIEIRGCTFRGNREDRIGNFGGGGALWIDDAESTIVIDDCLFESNGGLDGGGAMDLYLAQDGAVISRCRFVDNDTSRDGSALLVHAIGLGQQLPRARVKLDQCLFAGNEAVWLGGAVALKGIASDRISNCTFSDNDAPEPGAALAALYGAQPTVVNTIIRGGGAMAPIVASGSGASVALVRCNLQGGAASIATLGGATSSYLDAVDGDPLFVDPVGLDGLAGTAFDNDYRLSSGSVAVDAGNNGLIAPDDNDIDGDGDDVEPVPLDVDGHSRRADDPGTPDTGIGGPPIVDLGPYERR